MKRGVTRRTFVSAALLALASPTALAAAVEPDDGIIEEDGFEYLVENGAAVVTDYTGGDTRVSIPDELGTLPVEKIGQGAFFGCPELVKVTIPSSVTSIESGAFSSCDSLESVELPSSLESIGDFAFFGCPKLVEVKIPSSVTSIGSSVFSFCDSLERIQVDPDNPKYASIDGVLFEKGTKSLLRYPDGRAEDSYAVPEGIKAIAEDAFSSCDSLESIELPSSLESIAGGALKGCNKIMSIEVNPFNATYVTVDGALVDMSQNALVRFPPALLASSYAVPDFVVSIESGAFHLCIWLDSIELPRSLESIGSYAFSGCLLLESIELPSSLESIGDCAFYYCMSLKKVTVPSSVTSIGRSVFSGCTSLESVEVPKSVEFIGDNAFPNNPGFSLKVTKGSYAQEWASSNDIPYDFSDQTDWLTAQGEALGRFTRKA